MCPGSKDKKEMRILSKIAAWTKEGIEYEGDQGHVEISMKDLLLDENSMEVPIPIDKNTNNLDKYR